MKRQLTCALLLGAGLLCQPPPAAAQRGAPVEGQFAGGGFALVAVSWDGTEEDPGHEIEGAALGGFTLFGALSQGGPPIATLRLTWPPPTPRPPEFVVMPVPPGVYWVVAVKGLTDSTALVPMESWQQVVVQPPCATAPAAPVSLQASQQSNNVYVHWEPAPGSCFPTSYELHAGYTPGQSDAGVFQFYGPTFYGPAPPGTYYIRVRARNAFGVSGFSAEVRLDVTGTTCIGPGAPRQLTAAVVGHTVTLNWLPPASPGSRPIAVYGLTAGLSPGTANAANVVLPAAQTSFQATAPAGTYYVSIRATNGCGGSYAWGAPSNEVIVVVPQ